MTEVLSVCEREAAWLEALVRELVLAESPSDNPAALEACALLLQARLAASGAAVKRVSEGGHVIASWPGRGPRVLMLGHFDTVWPVGQLSRMPLREDDGKLYGPGIFDMKAGLAIGTLAARAVAERVEVDRRPQITLLATSDEEVGSRTSRALIEQLARDHDAVLVLEPSLPGGAVKTARKGVGDFRIAVQGVASHAGVDPSAGASAVHELARQILAIEALADPARGLTINVGVIAGGTRSNVVAESANAHVDVRISRLEDAARVESAFAALRPVHPRTTVHVSGGINRPPLERTAGVVKLYELARKVAGEMGDELSEGATGGGSDGNFTGALGVPTLDGLGGIGAGPHALHEHVVLKALPRRAALVAGLVVRLGDN